MANIHGKNAYFQIEDSNAASRNITADGQSVKLGFKFTNPELTAFGDTYVNRGASGIGDLTIDYSGWANDAASSNLDVFNNIAGRIGLCVFGPAGSAASSVKYSACVLLDKYDVDTTYDGFTKVSATFVLASGSLTKGTF